MTVISSPSGYAFLFQLFLGTVLLGLIGCTGAPSNTTVTPQCSGSSCAASSGNSSGNTTGSSGNTTGYNYFNPYNGNNPSDSITWTGANGQQYVALSGERCEQNGDEWLSASPSDAGTGPNDPGYYGYRVDWAERCDTADQAAFSAAAQATGPNGENLHLYPSYGILVSNGSSYPTPEVPNPPGPVPYTSSAEQASCSNTYSGAAIPSNYTLIAFCSAGCLRGDTQMLVADSGVTDPNDPSVKLQKISDLYNAQQKAEYAGLSDPAVSILALSESSSWGSLSLISRPVKKFTGSPNGNNSQKVKYYAFDFGSDSNGVEKILYITPEHLNLVTDDQGTQFAIVETAEMTYQAMQAGYVRHFINQSLQEEEVKSVSEYDAFIDANNYYLVQGSDFDPNKGGLSDFALARGYGDTAYLVGDMAMMDIENNLAVANESGEIKGSERYVNWLVDSSNVPIQ